MATVAAIRRCLQNYSIEVTPGQARKIKDFGAVAGLRAGTAVNVTCLPGADPAESVDICARLTEAGLRPVAHVPARNFLDVDAVRDYVTGLRGVGVDEVLALGGGAPTPVGALHETMQLLEAGLFAGFARIGVAAHPEGHPDVAAAELDDAMARKVAWAKREGVELCVRRAAPGVFGSGPRGRRYLETQFCFDAAPIVSWESRPRRLFLFSSRPVDEARRPGGACVSASGTTRRPCDSASRGLRGSRTSSSSGR